jgi:hypothetical protein
VAALAACAAGGLNAAITALTPHQIGHQLREAIIVALRPAEFDRHIAALEHIRTRQDPDGTAQQMRHSSWPDPHGETREPKARITASQQQ